MAASRASKAKSSMPKIKTSDGVNLYYEEAGTGTPVVFVHEFASDYRTWESENPQRSKQ
jgi:pimeloyl-ACP methyl ester carboxylesterase